jgi:hypothetical protein
MSMARFLRWVAITALLAVSAGVPRFGVSGASAASAGAISPPEGAVRFAEQHFLRIVEEIVFADRPSEWGFREDKGTITFSDLYPIYGLNADFALGRSEAIAADRPTQWVAVIFQDGRPVNAVGTRQTADGRFELAALGYAPELPRALLQLNEREIVIHEEPEDLYYVYAEETDTIRQVEPSAGTYRLGPPQSREAFQHMLTARYRTAEKQGERPLPAVFGAAAVLAVLGTVWLVRRKMR